MSWIDRISFDPQVCHGKACIKGTRVLVSVVLDSLAEGMSEAEILQEYPSLPPDAIQAVLAYAAMLAREEILPLSPERSQESEV